MPVARIQGITEQWVQVVRLELEASATFEFSAGQYLEIQHPSGVGIPLSIASAPHRLPVIELHYRSTPGDALAPLLDELLDARQPLELSGPFGDVIVTSPSPSLFLAAGGTGITQALAIVEHIQYLTQHFAELKRRQPDITLLWCADTADALYAREHLESLSWLDVHTIVDPSKTQDNDALAWIERRLSSKTYDRVLLCGGPAFVYAVVDRLEMRHPGVVLESDVFGYSPRG